MLVLSQSQYVLWGLQECHGEEGECVRRILEFWLEKRSCMTTTWISTHRTLLGTLNGNSTVNARSVWIFELKCQECVRSYTYYYSDYFPKIFANEMLSPFYWTGTVQRMEPQDRCIDPNSNNCIRADITPPQQHLLRDINAAPQNWTDSNTQAMGSMYYLQMCSIELFSNQNTINQFSGKTITTNLHRESLGLWY